MVGNAIDGSFIPTLTSYCCFDERQRSASVQQDEFFKSCFEFLNNFVLTTITSWGLTF